MSLDLYIPGVLIGSVIRSGSSAYAYDPTGRVVGQFSDLDAAAHALARLLEPQDAPEAEAA